jgi:hypothetical protein
MKRTLIALLMTAVACSGQAPYDPEEEEEQEEQEEEELDTTPPTILSMSPANGAVGVREDEPVVITFSEPMDRGSVEGTLFAASLGDVTLKWNGAGDVLTIVPDEPLPYAQGIGDDPDDVTALHYYVVVGTGARDLAGNPIVVGAETSFWTMKRMETVYKVDETLTAEVGSEGGVSTSSSVYVGDDAGDTTLRGVFTFPLDTFPASAVEIVHARFATRQLGVDGDPYGDLGDKMKIEHVSFGVLADAYDAPALAQLGDFCEEGQVVIMHDVTAAVADDVAHRVERGDRSQYRLYFETLTNGDDYTDYAKISRDLAELTIVYLAH